MTKGKDQQSGPRQAVREDDDPSLRDILRAAITHHRSGRLAEAADLYQRVLKVQPDNLGACNNLGLALGHQRRDKEAIECFRRALAIDPGAHEILVNLADVLKRRGKVEEAIACLRRALASNPDNVQTLLKLGITLHGIGDLEGAGDHFEKALVKKPDIVDAHHNLGNVRQDQGRMDAAVRYYRQALSLNPDLEQTHSSLGNALRHLGKLDEALHHHRQAVSIDPEYAVGHLNKSVTDLLLGDFDTGLAEYEWRWRSSPFLKSKRTFSQPMWDGTSLEGRTILLHVEQGLGDAIQFVRYAPLVRDRGARIVVECQAPLVRLISNMNAVDSVIAEGDARPDFDVYAPLMSLPYIFCTTVASIPAHVPYLVPPQTAPAVLAAAGNGRFRVGIVWAGSPTHTNDRNRSCRIEQFEPLLSTPGIWFCSLQKGPAAAALKHDAFHHVHNLGEHLSDLSDTAAVIQQLDLVISVDTSIVHLTGALAKPVWILVPFAPDWRWLCEREDSPWYPTARLFRQTAIGEWDSVFSRMAAELESYSGGQG